MSLVPPSNTSSQAPAARHQLLTLYGRKPVLEALQDSKLLPERLHLASTNRRGGIVDRIVAEADRRGVVTLEHDRAALARISKNGKQDQGVALDVRCPGFGDLDELADRLHPGFRMLALDGVTNPQNAGMIVRSAAAAGIDALLWPKRGVAALGPLVIKASAGTVFRAPIVQCETLEVALDHCGSLGMAIAILSADADKTVFEFRQDRPTVYVMGGETDGVSAGVRERADMALTIPMTNGVESLNVAVSAALLAYATAH